MSLQPASRQDLQGGPEAAPTLMAARKTAVIYGLSFSRPLKSFLFCPNSISIANKYRGQANSPSQVTHTIHSHLFNISVPPTKCHDVHLFFPLRTPTK